jgi:hypothetical protein
MGDVKHTCEIAGKESRQCRISESAWSNDSEIPLTIILQEVRKELKHVSLLRIFQSRNKMQKSTLAYEATIFCSNGIVAILNCATLDIGVYSIQVLANLV